MYKTWPPCEFILQRSRGQHVNRVAASSVSRAARGLNWEERGSFEQIKHNHETFISSHSLDHFDHLFYDVFTGAVSKN